MTNYRNSKFIERYEDVVYQLDTALNLNIANDASQKKDGHKFFVDNSGETTPLDWYHARFNVDFKLVLLADGMVNSAHSFIKKLIVKMNGNDVYTCSEVNHATNIKNLLEYSQGYVKSQGTNEFFYLGTTRNANEIEFPTKIVKAHANNAGNNENDPTEVLGLRNANYNKGFAARKALLGVSSTVNVEIPLNRYGFFQSLYLKLLPTSKIELEINLESDANLVWQARADCRVVLTKFQLIIPRIAFNAEGKTLFMTEYLNIEKPIKWNYLREEVSGSESTQQQNAATVFQQELTNLDT